MTTLNAPPLANWILRHFAAGPDRDTIEGDLLEHYRRGRSRSWYWLQVFTAINQTVFRDVRDNTLSLFRAVTVGMMFLVIWRQFVLPALLSTVWSNRLFDSHTTQWAYWVAMIQFAITTAASGWMVARVARTHRVSAVLFFISGYSFFYLLCSLSGFPHRLLLKEQAISCVLTVTIGWIVSKLGYTQRFRAVLVFTVGFLLLAALDSWMLSQFLRIGLHFDLGSQIGWTAMNAALILIGSGLLFRKRDTPESNQLTVAAPRS